ncbi:MAG: cyclic pyranopterin monophosphate synthase MoaC [Firmicutes bacterium]|nr:cyclic pyranopterin monophosphate synthase MoaC [Bacillota bacterium]MBQ9604015.1 cyclic pyranopterin monophosphate synthase MoaC [Bacillota bacterium]
MGELTHTDQNGKAAMVDVTDKEITERTAVACGRITMSGTALTALKENTLKKGDALSTAKIAGIMGAKKTAELIPLCHPLMLTKISIDFELDEKTNSVLCRCSAKLKGRTGVEMEALTGVNIALLTIYDMCKALDKNMVISDIHLEEKKGGKSGEHYFKGNATI